MIRASLAVLLACLAVACGSSGSAPSQPVAGVLPDQSAFQLASARAARPASETCTHFTVTGPVAVLNLYLDGGLPESYPGSFLCDYRQGAGGIFAQLWTYQPGGAIGPGTYVLRDDTTGGLRASAWTTDATCDSAGFWEAITASVTITRSDAHHVAGHLDVTLPGGTRVTGAFDALMVDAVFGTCETLGFDGGTPGPGCSAIACVP